MKNDYIMWSDGVFTLLGKKLKKVGDTITVADPVTVVPTTEQEPIDDKGNTRSVMRFEITPLVFRAALKDQSKNIWKIKPSYVLEDTEFEDGLINQYEYIIKATERPAGIPVGEPSKSEDNDLIVK